MTQMTHGTVSFIDLTRDGRYDIFASGLPSIHSPTPSDFSYQAISQQKDGEQQLEYESSAFPTSGWNTRPAWGDFNNDGWLDLAVSGIAERDLPYVPVTRLYQGGPNGFEAAQNLPDLRSGSTSWTDYDNDGDEDLLLTGIDAENAYHTKLYENVNGTLNEVGTGLPGIAYGDAAWADFDNDQDNDLFLTGTLEDGTYFSRLYRNDDGALVPMSTEIEQVLFSSAAWGDYNADGDLDLAVNGARLGAHYFEGVTRIYRNTGDSLVLSHSFSGTYFGDIGWGDYDNSGTLDLIITGARGHNEIAVSQIYRNVNNVFEHSVTLPGASASSFDAGDADGDGDLDLVLSGQGLDGDAVTAIYQNTRETVNTPPTSPSGLDVTVEDSAIVMTWNPSNDSLTATEGLSYAVRVGTSPGGIDVVAPMANTDTGRRLLPGIGNAGSSTQWRIRDLPAGTYYWGVQAIDASFTGSDFSQEGTFTISHETIGTNTGGPGVPAEFVLHAAHPNPSRSSVTIGYEVPAPTNLSIAIYDVLGRRIVELKNGPHTAGTYRAVWNPDDVGAGVYVCRLTTTDGWTDVTSLTILD